MRSTNILDLASIEPGDVMFLERDVLNVRIDVEWTTKSLGIICDLDLTLYLYNERAMLIEKLDSTNNKSYDGCCDLLSDLDVGDVSHVFMESVKIEIGSPKSASEAFLVIIDGGPRNFRNVGSLCMRCYHIPSDRKSDNLTDELSTRQTKPICKLNGKAKSEYSAVALGVIYKDGWHSENKPRWALKAFMEPIFICTSSEMEDKCTELVVSTAPSLQKFRSRLFSCVRDICTALSSTALPKLKKKFLKTSHGLAITPFTEVIFKQLFEAHPKITDEKESSYVVALIQEVFNQIDFNGDQYVDWDEFTTFIIQNSLVDGSYHSRLQVGGQQAIQVKGGVVSTTAGSQHDILDTYTIEYYEDLSLRDRVLSNYKKNTFMRFVNETRKVLVIPHEPDCVKIFSEHFALLSTIYPHKIQSLGGAVMPTFNNDESDIIGGIMPALSTQKDRNSGTSTKFCIYDVIYLEGRDLYAFTASDHTLVICKEHLSVGSQVTTTFFYHDKIYHRALHYRLCWSPKHSILVSIAADHSIHGWNIDKGVQIFQTSRHTDIVTDIVCADEYDSFITCSMDKTIVMWSALTRRVRGIFLGHERGVRTLDNYKSVLLSSGFECEARTWDINTREPVAILKGHRVSIRAAKLMCEGALSERDYRAITVDVSGEFRLWDIYIKERSSGAVQPALTLQIFYMANPESPIDHFEHIAIPSTTRYTQGVYSDIIACSSKLVHFLPTKHTKEFSPPTHSVFNEITSTLYTATGKSLHKYDVLNGKFLCTYHDIYESDLSLMMLDGVQGRRLFIGTVAGDLLLVNCSTGTIIDKINLHSREITGLIAAVSGKGASRKAIYTSGLDGKIRSIEELGGKLHVHNTIEKAFNGIGVESLRLVNNLPILIAKSASKAWGLWNELSFKKMFVIHEDDVVLAIETIGTSQVLPDPVLDHSHPSQTTTQPKKTTLLTLAVALPTYIQIYCVDTNEVRGLATMKLSFNPTPSYQLNKRRPSMKYLNANAPTYITDLRVLSFPTESVNHSRYMNSSQRLIGLQLIASTDDGHVLIWNMENIRESAESLFKLHRSDTNSDLAVDLVFSPRSKNMPEVASTFSSNNHSLRKPTLVSDIKKIASENAPQLKRKSTFAVQSRSGSTASSLPESKRCSMREERNKILNELLKSLENDDSDSDEDPIDFPKTSLRTRRLSLINGKGPLHLNTLEPQAEVDDFKEENDCQLGVLGGEYSSDIFNSSHDIKTIHPNVCYQGHCDSITTIINLSSHGCIATVSLDGYHRIWNADHDCLGELYLPNVTDAMKLRRNELSFLQNSNNLGNNSISLEGSGRQMPKDSNNTGWEANKEDDEWRFITESLQVTKEHETQAKMLISSLVTGKLGGWGNNQYYKRDSKELLSPITSPKGSSRLLQSMVTAIKQSQVSPRLPVDIPQQQQSLQDMHVSLNSPKVYTRKKAEIFPSPRRELSDKLNRQSSKISDTPGSPPKSAPSDNSTFDLKNQNSIKTEILQVGFPDDDTVSEAPSTKSLSRSRSRQMHRETPSLSRRGDREALRNAALLAISSPLYVESEGQTSLPPNNNSMNVNAFLSSDDFEGIENPRVEASTISSSTSMWYTPDVAFNGKAKGAPAFSEASINSSFKEGKIDGEAYKILQKIGKHAERIAVFEKTQPLLLLRNPTLSVDFEMPSYSENSYGAAEFGVQRDLYKNALCVLEEKNHMSSGQVRNSVALERVEASVRHIKSMVSILPPVLHADVALPLPDYEGKAAAYAEKVQEELRKRRLDASAALVPAEAAAKARPLDMASIHSKLRKIEETMAEESRKESKQFGYICDIDANRGKDAKKSKEKTVSFIPEEEGTLASLEKRFCQAIRDEFRNRTLLTAGVLVARKGRERTKNLLGSSNNKPGKPSEKKNNNRITLPRIAVVRKPEKETAKPDSNIQESKATEDAEIVIDQAALDADFSVLTHGKNKVKQLSTRTLLPHYRIEDVSKFVDIFTKVDVDYSGDLDMMEWVRFFSSLSKNFSAQEARMVFMKIDANGDGSLSLSELVPIVFNKANKDQLKAIINYVESEIIRKHTGSTVLSHEDVRLLFEGYDKSGLGFISVGLIRDRVKSFNLAETMLYMVMDMMKDVNMNDNEMMNFNEFARLLKPFSVKD